MNLHLLRFYIFLLIWTSAESLHDFSQSFTFSNPIPSSSPSLFGFAVTVFSHNTQYYVLVSDPSANNSYTNTSSGNVFICQVSKLNFNSSGPFCSTSVEFKYPMTDDANAITDYMKIGFSVSSLLKDQFSICAPGYVFTNTFNETVFPGVCAVWSSPSSSPVWVDKMFPYQPASLTTSGFEHYGKCLGGFASKLFLLDNRTMFLASGPFCRAKMGFKGYAITENKKATPVLTIDLSKLDGAMQFYPGLAFDVDLHSKKLIYSSPVYFSENRIVFMKSELLSGDKYESMEMSKDNKFFEKNINYLGYSIISIKCKSKSYVILGAPYHSELESGLVDSGCIFVFESNKNNDNFQSYCSKENKGQFGHSLLNIGDINYDGIDDFAVGCPRCGAQNTGSVYIFLGQDYISTSNFYQPFEIIHSSNVSSHLKGFGWAMATGIDLDSNAANEIVVTSVFSNHVSVIPSKLLLNGFAQLNTENKDIEGFITDVDIISKTYSVKIKMEIKKGLRINDYNFQVLVKLTEDCPSLESERFFINITNLKPYPLSAYKGLYQLETIDDHSSGDNIVQFKKIDFKLGFLPATMRQMPSETVFRDFKLNLYIEVIPNSNNRNNKVFPAVVFNNQLLENNKGNLTLNFINFKPITCTKSAMACHLSPNIGIKLLNSSSILISERQIMTLVVKVHKQHGEFYGGVVLKIKTKNALVLDRVIMHKDGISSNLKYWSKSEFHTDYGDIFLSQPFATVPDMFSIRSETACTVAFQVNLDPTQNQYNIDFELKSLFADKSSLFRSPIKDDPVDNHASVEIKMNNSLTVSIYEETLRSTIVDARTSATYKDIVRLTSNKAVYAKDVGPAFNHTYQLVTVTRPWQPISDLSVSISVPFMLWDKQLLILFPKEFIQELKAASAAGGSIKRFNGLPFVSDNINSFGGESCQLNPPDSIIKSELQHYLSKGMVMLEHKSSKNFNSSATNLGRQRREVKIYPEVNAKPKDVYTLYTTTDTTVPSKTDTNPASSSTKNSQPEIPVFDCDRPHLAPTHFHCLKFTCNIRPMNDQTHRETDSVFISIIGRLWSDTFFRRKINHFKIRTSVVVNLPKTSAFQTITLTNSSTCEQEFLFSSMLPKVPPLDWKYIILAIFLGIIILLLCILLLWYLNFFKRKRIHYEKVPMGDKNTFEGDEFYQ